MRIAFPHQLRARPHWNAGPALRRCRFVQPCLRILCSRIAAVHTSPEPLRGRVSTQRLLHADTTKPTKSSRDAEDKPTDSKDGRERTADHGQPAIRPGQRAADVSRLSREDRQNPDAWVRLIEEHMPGSWKTDGKDRQRSGASLSDASCNHILALLNSARRASDTETDILAYMIVRSQKQSAIWLCNNLLRRLAARRPSRPTELPPSNIIWPNISLDRSTRRSIQPNSLSYISTERSDNWESIDIDPRYSSSISTMKNSTMDQIWTTLGSVVVQSADMGEEDAQNALNAVRLILGEIHNLDLVPDNVYSYRPSTAPTTTQRPPIIHLLSSRILTALSDAAWRDQQNENIEKAASHGLSYEEIGRDPPGGRFRLKVRPLDPEMWLEFILWCCVEGGYMGAGRRIVSLLQRNTQNPWFAVTWSGSSGTGHTTAHIDWERVRSRTGGTVGRLEGYSKVKPLAEVPARTISTEVVLALVEGHIDAIQRTEKGHGTKPESAQNAIVQLISFLEPHDLPVSYFDYVSSRLFMTEAFDVDRSKLFKKWSDKLSLLKALNPVRQPPPPQASFQLNAVLTHSEFSAGILHQVLDSFVQEGNIHDALKTFNDIQKLVDNSKLHAISSFLQAIPTSGEDFFSSRVSSVNSDFVGSHGQLPMYKLAGVLNLATDTNLIGFGQWLVYTEDPDGPLIRKSAYNTSGMARALVRFAALSRDYQLLNGVSSGSQVLLMPTVSFLRTSFNARLSVLDVEGAWKLAKALKQAEGGGFGLSNLAQLAGTILKIEHDVFFTPLASKEALLAKTRTLLTAMLSGSLDGRSGVYQRSVRKVFRQQVSHLLTIFESFPNSSISAIARENRHRFRVSNIPNLSPSIFNIFLEAVAEAKGPLEGINLVETFCTLPNELEENVTSQILPGDYIVEDETEAESRWTEISIATSATSQVSEPYADNTNPAESSGVSTRSTAVSGVQSFIPFVQSQDLVEDKIRDDMEVTTQNRTQEEEEEMKPEEELVNPIAQISEAGNMFTSPFFPDGQISAHAETRPEMGEEMVTEDSDDGSLPVCIHDVRTIRLVVRSASQQTQKQEDAGQEEFQQSPVLEWARHKFAELGCTPTMISNEIKEPTAETQMVGDVRTKRSSLNTMRRAKKKRISRITRGFGIPATPSRSHTSPRTVYRSVNRENDE